MTHLIRSRLSGFILLGIAALMTGLPVQAVEPNRIGMPSGTYYLALDAEPFGLPEGLSLPGIATLHADRTFQLVDGGDFGGMPFPTRDSAQLGTWRRNGKHIEVVTLFLQADAFTGEVLSWQKVHLKLSRIDRDRFAGKVNVFALPCDDPVPYGVFGCPDPIRSAADFVPASPPDIPVTLTRLRVQ